MNILKDNRIALAKEFAYKNHEGQTRKSKDTPFTSHLDEVTKIISNLTNDLDLIAAAWLHDVVEDTEVTIDEIYSKFGVRVGRLVEIETEDKREGQSEETTWRVRKEEQLDELWLLDDFEEDVLLIALSDKLANLREMKEDYDVIGDKLWNVFNNKNRADHGWYYSSFLEIFREKGHLESTPEYKEIEELIEYLFF